ncbi:unnamed protein product [Toxocara canis]|uniref:F-box domain-containing protein n=1 Tax=Toxocara canis TaxID=6265 RepID=A0A183UPC3_TOXCA|nr:unnamed protein product [Toxocara canis]
MASENVHATLSYFTMMQPSTSSSCTAAKHRRRSLWRLAKRLIRPIGGPQTLTISPKVAFDCGSIESSQRCEQLVPPVLLNVFEQLNIYDRIRLRQACHSLFIIVFSLENDPVIRMKPPFATASPLAFANLNSVVVLSNRIRTISCAAKNYCKGHDQVECVIQISHLSDFLCTTIPVRLPPMKLQSASNGELYLLSEAPELIAYHLIPEIDLSEAIGDDGTVALKHWHAELILRRTARRVDHVEHLWLETSINGLLCAAFLKELQETNTDSKPYQRKITLNKLTVVGNKKSDLEQVSKMICCFSAYVEQLRLRHMRVESSVQSRDLWTAISMCRRLRQFQYETCRYDRHSHFFLSDALANKNICTLELGGVEELCSVDLAKLTENRPIKHLSVVCPKITCDSYLEDSVVSALSQLDTLLIQCEVTYALDDLEQRQKVAKVLQNMKAEASLEVVHVVDNHAAQAARIMSYWLELSRDTNRKVMLKLSEISQDRIDQAIGRLIRKCENVLKAAFRGSKPIDGNSLLLTRGNGRVHVLDKYTWFGDDDDNC